MYLQLPVSWRVRFAVKPTMNAHTNKHNFTIRWPPSSNSDSTTLSASARHQLTVAHDDFLSFVISWWDKSKAERWRLWQMLLHVCEKKNKAIPLVPRLPSPYSVPLQVKKSWSNFLETEKECEDTHFNEQTSQDVRIEHWRACPRCTQGQVRQNLCRQRKLDQQVPGDKQEGRILRLALSSVSIQGKRRYPLHWKKSW